MLLASWKQNFANPGVNWGGGYVLNHMNKEHLPLFEFAKQFYKAPINGRILDVGCGYGRTLKCLSDDGFVNLYGILTISNVISNSSLVFV